jgi:hypothetical protein
MHKIFSAYFRVDSFFFILLQNLSPVREPGWAQITQIFMDGVEALGAQLILYDNNKTCGQTGMVGDSGGW